MLLRVSVANFLSIKEPQELSVVASSLKDVEAGLIASASVPAGRVLPAAVIYGANASGKSNFMAAINFMRWEVLFSHSRGEPGGSIPRKPFALDPACAEKPSIFEVDFVIGGVRYQYGFEALDKAFRTEWLYAFPGNRRQMLFERIDDDFKFGRSLKGRNMIIADLTRPNSLFVSAATQFDHEQISIIAEFFRSMLSLTEDSVAMPRGAENGINERIIRVLDMIGTGVVDFRLREEEISETALALRREVLSVIRKYMKGVDTVEDERTVITELGHRGHNGETIFFEPDRESAGTRRLLPLLSKAFQALESGAPLLIDELNASLHTHACEAVLALFSSVGTNPHGGQLIATTHDTNLLRSSLLRRDQVWFAEKDAQGATHLYPLTDIRTRKGDNLEKGYLQGRYGAIPSAELLAHLETVR